MIARTWDSALLRLLTMQSRGKIRRIGLQLQNPQRSGLTWFAFALLALFLVLELIALIVRQPTNPQAFQAFLPLGMLGMCLLKLSRLCLGQQHTGVEFRSAEVVLLQAGPFAHRAIRAFKLSAHTVSISITALFASIFVWADVHFWPAGFAGAFFGMLFMYLLYMLVAVAAAYTPARLYNLGRIGFCAVVATAAGSSVIMAMSAEAGNLQSDGPNILATWLDSAVQLSHAPIGHVVLAPFRLFTGTMLAASYGALFAWVAACTAVNGVMLAAVLHLETWLVGRKIHTEQTQYEHGIAESSASSEMASVTADVSYEQLPRLPWMGGAGPIAWRQLTAVRHSLVGVTLCAALFSALIASVALVKSGTAPGNGVMVWFMIVTISQMLLPALLPFDFRRDLGEMVMLKSLPLAPRGVVLGQLMVPVAIATLCQMVVVLLVAIMRPEAAPHLLAGIVFYLPANLLIFGLENLAFLLYPYRITSFDMQATARRALMLFAKLLVLLVALLSALSIGLAVLGLSKIAGNLGAPKEMLRPFAYGALLLGWWLALGATWLGMQRALCWAFRRFDPSIDRAI